MNWFWSMLGYTDEQPQADQKSIINRHILLKQVRTFKKSKLRHIPDKY